MSKRGKGGRVKQREASDAAKALADREAALRANRAAAAAKTLAVTLGGKPLDLQWSSVSEELFSGDVSGSFKAKAMAVNDRGILAGLPKPDAPKPQAAVPLAPGYDWACHEFASRRADGKYHPSATLPRGQRHVDLRAVMPADLAAATTHGAPSGVTAAVAVTLAPNFTYKVGDLVRRREDGRYLPTTGDLSYSQLLRMDVRQVMPADLAAFEAERKAAQPARLDNAVLTLPKDPYAATFDPPQPEPFAKVVVALTTNDEGEIEGLDSRGERLRLAKGFEYRAFQEVRQGPNGKWAPATCPYPNAPCVCGGCGSTGPADDCPPAAPPQATVSEGRPMKSVASWFAWPFVLFWKLFAWKAKTAWRAVGGPVNALTLGLWGIATVAKAWTGWRTSVASKRHGDANFALLATLSPDDDKLDNAPWGQRHAAYLDWHAAKLRRDAATKRHNRALARDDRAAAVRSFARGLWRSPTLARLDGVLVLPSVAAAALAWLAPAEAAALARAALAAGMGMAETLFVYGVGFGG